MEHHDMEGSKRMNTVSRNSIDSLYLGICYHCGSYLGNPYDVFDFNNFCNISCVFDHLEDLQYR